MKLMKYIAFYLCLQGTMSACSNEDDNYSPGTPITENCEQVYFANSNESTALLPANDSSQRSVTLLVKRMVSSDPTTVPIRLLSKTEGVTIPEAVTFEAGQQTAEITISIPTEAELGDIFSYQIELTGENVDPYTILDGSIRFFGNIQIENFYLATGQLGSGKYGPFETNILITNENQYQINDLLGSGYYLSFTVNPDTGQLTNIKSDGGYLYENYWYFYDSSIGYLPFNDTVTYIQALYNGTGYTYWNESEKELVLYLYGVYYSDGTNNTWDYISLTW